MKPLCRKQHWSKRGLRLWHKPAPPVQKTVMIQKYVACHEGVCVSQRLLASHMHRLTATWYDKGIIKHYTVIVIVILPGGA